MDNLATGILLFELIFFMVVLSFLIYVFFKRCQRLREQSSINRPAISMICTATQGNSSKLHPCSDQNLETDQLLHCLTEIERNKSMDLGSMFCQEPANEGVAEVSFWSEDIINIESIQSFLYHYNGKNDFKVDLESHEVPWTYLKYFKIYCLLGDVV